jgi:magnesium transporter
MRETVVESREPAFTWIDVTDPSPAELAALAREHQLHPVTLKDCLDPEHLPKFEKLGPLTFAIVRAFDESAPADADNVREMTRKVALFVGAGLLITVHRKPQAYLEGVKERVTHTLAGQDRPAAAVTAALIEAVLQTFRRPLEAAETAADTFEEKLFEHEDVTGVIRQVYTMKRRVTVMRWMMRHTRDVIPRLGADVGELGPVYQDLRETADQLYFTASELIEDVNHLLDLQLSMAAHKTNEVMTVLTIFSVFFLPLTFIVGIYGMNFQHIPEIHAWGKWGYPFSWALMIGASAAIALWFRRKGWL